MSNKMQRYTVYFIWKLLFMFRGYHHPVSGAQTTVSTASGICHTVTSNIYPTRFNVTQFIWKLLYMFRGYHHPSSGAPDDGWWYHPKHVEQFPVKINCVTLHLVEYILEYITLFGARGGAIG